MKSVFGIFYFLILLLKKPEFGVKVFVHSVCQVDCKIIPFGNGKALREHEVSDVSEHEVKMIRA